MIGQALVILLSSMHRSVWMKSEMPVSKLVLQRHVAGSQVTCSETCASENLICNFGGINFVPPEELEAKIVELLPDKVCSHSTEMSTLTSDEKKYNSSKQLFAYNRHSECTSRYIFTPGGPIPKCSTLPDSKHLLICKCQSKRDYKLVVQPTSSRIAENCDDICSRQGLTCNFEGINLIPLEDLKAQIIDLFPGSYCYDNKTDFTFTKNAAYTHYRRGSVLYHNIANHCTARYIFSPTGPIPSCASRLDEKNNEILICKCQISRNGGCQTTNKTGEPATIDTADTTVVPCGSAVISKGVLAALGLGFGVVLSCGGMLLCGLVWRERSRARRAGPVDSKRGEKGRSNIKWKNKTKKSFGTDDAKCSYDSKTSAAASDKTKGTIRSLKLTPRSKDKKLIHSKTKERNRSTPKNGIKSKTEALKSVVYNKVPESDYETIRH